MTALRILADVVELDGQPVARLLPKLGPTLVDGAGKSDGHFRRHPPLKAGLPPKLNPALVDQLSEVFTPRGGWPR